MSDTSEDTGSVTFAIQCFKNEERRPTDELTDLEAICFRRAAQHLMNYLTKRYKLSPVQEIGD